MDLYIDRNELIRGLSRVQGVVERRSTTPVLAHVLLHARDGQLRMTATDTEVAYIGQLAANVQVSGEVATDAANLFQVVRNLPEPTVQLTVTGGHRVEVRSGRSHFKLPGIAAAEYPSLPAFDATGTATLTSATLQRLVAQTVFSVASDDRRYGLNGAHLEAVEHADGQRLRMVATDGHRLSAAEGPVEGALAITPKMLVPRKAMNVLRKLLDGGESPLELAFGEGAIRLTQDEQSFWFRLLDGEFPDYQIVLPSETRHRVVLDRQALLSSLKRVAVLVGDGSRAVRFAFTEDEVSIRVQNVDKGEVDEVVGCELDGEPITIGFNVKYLQEILGAMDGPQIALEMSHALGATLLKDPDADTAFFVVMPMRLD